MASIKKSKGTSKSHKDRLHDLCIFCHGKAGPDSERFLIDLKILSEKKSFQHLMNMNQFYPKVCVKYGPISTDFTIWFFTLNIPFKYNDDLMTNRKRSVIIFNQKM